MESAPVRAVRQLNLSRSNSQRSLILAMLDPSFYPHEPSEVTHLETHISHLFFAGELVYKIKKALRYSFVDYSTLAKRRFFLHEELRLNRRLAPSVYLGVLPISRDDHGWQLGSDLRPAEYILVMRRLPARRMLDDLLERGQVTPQMMRALAEFLAPFHSEAPRDQKIRARGNPDAIRKVWEGNLADLAPFVGRLLDAETFETLRANGAGFLAEQRELMLDRAREGRTREVHGDLHCEHICFAPEGIQIFDCVEFSPQLRCCDVASEIAFLMMDMEFRGAGELAREFLKRYLELTEDGELTKLLPFYQCYRALVRGKVYALQSEDKADPAARYLDLAYSYTWRQLKPFVVMICGLTGSGKSTLARALSRRLGAPVISSDVTRKALAGASERRGRVPYESGIYSLSMTDTTYDKIAAEAEKHLTAGEGVILDATFHKAAQRSAIFELAEKSGSPVALIRCHAPEGLTQERLLKRAAEGRDISDGSWEIYLKQREIAEPMAESSREPCLALNTEAPIAQLCSKAEQFLRSTFLDRRTECNSHRIQNSAANLFSASR